MFSVFDENAEDENITISLAYDSGVRTESNIEISISGLQSNKDQLLSSMKKITARTRKILKRDN